MIHFLIDASLPRPTADVCRQHGYDATDVRGIGLGTAEDALIASHARSNNLCLMTRDQDFGNVLDYPPADYHGIAVIQAHRDAPRQVVLDLIDAFLKKKDIVAAIAGRLVIIEPGRFRIRPPIRP